MLEDLHLLVNRKTYFKAIAIKTGRYWHKDKETNNRINSPETDQHKYSHLTYNKDITATLF